MLKSTYLKVHCLLPRTRGTTRASKLVWTGKMSWHLSYQHLFQMLVHHWDSHCLPSEYPSKLCSVPSHQPFSLPATANRLHHFHSPCFITIARGIHLLTCSNARVWGQDWLKDADSWCCDSEVAAQQARPPPPSGRDKALHTVHQRGEVEWHFSVKQHCPS